MRGDMHGVPNIYKGKKIVTRLQRPTFHTFFWLVCFVWDNIHIRGRWHFDGYKDVMKQKQNENG